MKMLPQQTDSGDIPVNWCNADAATSSVMEAVSFVTPILENFFIRTVVEGVRTQPEGELMQRCQEFIREESNHSVVHKKFNVSLTQRLNKQPPGLALISSLLDSARKHLSLSKRLALAAALEHFAAVISKLYISHDPRLIFASAYAKELFDMHAREELAHRCVVFDLWRAHGNSGHADRIMAIMAGLLASVIYVGVAVPWILHQKTDRNFAKTFVGLAGFVAKNLMDTLTHTPVTELLSFVRRDFHPKALIDDSQLNGV
jgi:predicted metal-dependent hydrolase